MDKKFLDQFDRMSRLLENCATPEKQQSEGSWTIKQIIGHLIDSVSNNHQRLIRYIPGKELYFPGYDQEACVSRANYNTFDFNRLYTLWHHYNQFLFHIYDNIPQADLSSEIKVGERPAISINALMKDYFAHMEIHEKQILDTINA